MHKAFTLLTSAILCSQLTAQPLQEVVPENTIRQFNNSIQWKAAPPTLPKGTQIAVLEGNPKTEGLFTIRLKAPVGMKLPVHQHPGPERVTIISGEIYVGFGDNYDEGISTKFTTGDYYVNPPNHDHYVFTKDKEAIVQITGMGPWKVIYKH